MLFPFCSAALVGAAAARSLTQPPVLQEPILDPQPDQGYSIPSIHDSAVMARRIMHLSSIGTLVTTFPDSSSSHSTASNGELASGTDDHQLATAFEQRPPEMAGSPIGLMEYYADCEPASGNPTFLAINIATPYKNHAAGSNISLQIRWWPVQTNTYSSAFVTTDDEDEDIPTPHTPAALPRFSLHGKLEPIPAHELATHLIPACFLRAHPDSVLWQPGNDIHTSQYMRFVVEHVYWFGGFGDRARIGWLPIEEWRGVTMSEVEGMRLPGEKRKKGGEEREW